MLAAEPDDLLELDELWSFVRTKRNQRWLWIALCRRTRQVVAYFSGDRSADSCRNLRQFIPQSYRTCCSCSDFWEAYQLAFDAATHRAVGKETGETAHVERWNNTLRQRLARFVRKTLAFSKSDHFHQLALQLFIHDYKSAYQSICNHYPIVRKLSFTHFSVGEPAMSSLTISLILSSIAGLFFPALAAHRPACAPGRLGGRPSRRLTRADLAESC